MIKKPVIYICFILLLNSVQSFTQNAIAGVSLLILGDSLTAGYGIPLTESWPSKIQEQWQKEYPEFQLINASISGETTAGALQRLPHLISTHQPNWVFIELGGNDGLRGYPLNTMTATLSSIIQLLHEQNIRVALSEVEIPPNFGPRYTAEFRQVFHTLASEYKDIVLIPFFMRPIAVQPQLMQADGLHPNVSAQAIIAQFMEPHLRQLLQTKD